MSYALTMSPPAPLRIWPMLLCLALMLASAVSLTPTLERTEGASSHSQVCRCAHCSGGATCCCRHTGKCPMPQR
jgi:hypothetical protein